MMHHEIGARLVNRTPMLLSSQAGGVTTGPRWRAKNRPEFSVSNKGTW